MSPGCPRSSPIDRSADARGRHCRDQPATPNPHHCPQREEPARAGPHRPLLHGDRAEPAVGGRHHLRADLARLLLSGRRSRRLLPPHCRVGDGKRSQDPACSRRPQHGDRAAPAPRRRSSQRSGITRRIQTVVATPIVFICRSHSSSASAGVFQPSVFRGLALRAAATAVISSALWMLRSVPFGKY